MVEQTYWTVITYSRRWRHSWDCRQGTSQSEAWPLGCFRRISGPGSAVSAFPEHAARLASRSFFVDNERSRRQQWWRQTRRLHRLWRYISESRNRWRLVDLNNFFFLNWGYEKISFYSPARSSELRILNTAGVWDLVDRVCPKACFLSFTWNCLSWSPRYYSVKMHSHRSILNYTESQITLSD